MTNTIADHMSTTLIPSDDAAATAARIIDGRQDVTVTVVLKVTGGAGRSAITFWQGDETVDTLPMYEVHDRGSHAMEAWAYAQKLYEDDPDGDFALFTCGMSSADSLRAWVRDEHGGDLDADDRLAREFNIRHASFSVYPPS